MRGSALTSRPRSTLQTMVADSQDRTIRVLYVIEGRLSGPGRQAVLLLASRLPRRRFETVVACQPDLDLVEALQRDGVTVTPLPGPAGFGIDAVLGPVREVRRHRAHVAHLYGCPGPVSATAARLARVPAVVCSRDLPGDPIPASGWRRHGRRLLQRASDRLIDRHVAMSRRAVQALTDDAGVDPARILMIPAGVELDRFAPERVRRGAWRSRVGVPADATLMCAFLGHDREAAGALLLRVLRTIEPRAGWLAVAFGAGSSLDELEDRARSLGLGDRVRFAEPDEGTRELLGDADLVLGLGGGGDSIGIREAMAMARPIVALDSADGADAVSDGVDGRVVAAGDAAALVEAIRALLGDPVAAERMGRKARKKAEREFSVERMVRRAAILYEEVLREKGYFKTSTAGVGTSR